jgi:hypothetical protein
LAIGLGVIVAVGAALVAYFILWGSARFAECFATFESAEVAGRAIETTHDAGFDAELWPRSERVVVFSSGETG